MGFVSTSGVLFVSDMVALGFCLYVFSSSAILITYIDKYMYVLSKCFYFKMVSTLVISLVA